MHKHLPIALTVALSVGSSAVTAALILGAQALADGNPATDSVPRRIAYNGTLELDGEPYNGAVTLRFSLYDGAGDATADWTETQAVAAYEGRFSVQLGSSSDISSVATNADDLYLGIEVIAVDGAPLDVPVPLAGRQRFTPVPSALWAAESADFSVNRDLFVARNASVLGTLASTGALSTASNLDVTGTSTLRGATSLASTLSVSGASTLTGALTVGGVATLQNSAVVNGTTTLNGALTVYSNVAVGTPGVPSTLSFNGTRTDLNFPANIGGGGGDTASIRHFVDGTGENTQLLISNGNDPDDDVAIEQAGAVRLQIVNGVVGVTGDLSADSNAYGTCEWTAWSCGAFTCPNGRYVAGFDTIGNGNGEQCYGAGDYDEPYRRLYCCEL